jgi:hypothetical protein
MAGVLQWSPDKWLGLTLRQLVTPYDAYLVNTWDHTATVACLLHNIQATVINMGSKTRVKPKSLFDFHPYRKKPYAGLRIGPKNMHLLRQLGNLIISQKRN